MSKINLPGAPEFSRYLNESFPELSFFSQGSMDVVKRDSVHGIEYAILMTTSKGGLKNLGVYFIQGTNVLPRRSYNYLLYDGVIPGYINPAIARCERGETIEKMMARLQNERVDAVRLRWGECGGKYRRLDFHQSIPFP